MKYLGIITDYNWLSACKESTSSEYYKLHSNEPIGSRFPYFNLKYLINSIQDKMVRTIWLADYQESSKIYLDEYITNKRIQL